MQVKLLRLLQEREIERVGGTRAVKIDVRVIAGHERRPEVAVQREAFREDLTNRPTCPAGRPPLPERASDIPAWSSTSSAAASASQQAYRRALAGGARRAPGLRAGNVRELKNVIEPAWS